MAEKKRSPDQIVRDRARIAELKLMHHTDQQIADILQDETGIELSRRQINYDMGKIRDQWRTAQHDAYNTLVMMELARIDTLEKEIWEAIRKLSDGEREKQRVVREVRKKLDEAAGEADDSGYGLVIAEQYKTIENASIPSSYFSQIIECQKERRRLLGLYAPTQIGVQKTVVVKGYKTISPEDWPDVIEGRIVGD